MIRIHNFLVPNGFGGKFSYRVVRGNTHLETKTLHGGAEIAGWFSKRCGQ